MEENKEYKYKCDNCNFYCNEISKWNKHIETKKHKTGKRADYIGEHKCDKCEYKNKNIIAYKQHILNNHSTIEQKEKEYIYYCKTCDFGCFSKKLIEKHFSTDKHKIKIL